MSPLLLVGYLEWPGFWSLLLCEYEDWRLVPLELLVEVSLLLFGGEVPPGEMLRLLLGYPS